MQEVCRIELGEPLSGPILAAGGDLKCALALGRGREVVVYEDLGDLAVAENHDRFQASLSYLLREMAAERPSLTCDLHPDYLSAQTFRRIARERGLRLVEVQHHRAHVASVAVEHDLMGRPVIGLAFDGTGYGDDGTIWGGEFFTGTVRTRLVRRGSFAPLTLCGGDAAVRQPWRIALALLIEHGLDDERLRAWAGRTGVRLPPLDLFRRALTQGLQCVRTTALGRWFDAFSALWGLCTEVQVEAQAAVAMRRAAESHAGGCFLGAAGVRWMGEEMAVIHFDELLETVDYLIADWGPDHAAAWARQFHCCVADAAAGVAHRFAQQTGADAVIYSGGCFLNSLLCDMLDRRFERLGLRRVRSMRLRPGDQALALGQVVLADAELRTRGVNAT